MSPRYAYNPSTLARAASPARQRDDAFEVIRPTRRAQESAVTPLLLTIAKIVAVAIVVIAALSFARIALNSATIVSSLDSQELSSTIDTLRSEGSTLELSLSAMASPDRLKSQATTLGYAAPATTEVVTLAPDVVAVSDEGSLLLAGSLSRLAAG